MKEFQHERLLQLYGVCTVSEPFCIITELMKNGSLKKYLVSKCNKTISVYKNRQLRLLLRPEQNDVVINTIIIALSGHREKKDIEFSLMVDFAVQVS